jgi:prepilin-type N-terminal cleavage/methylation domain-containing protein
MRLPKVHSIPRLDETGFTLVEVLVALAIVTCAAAGLAGLVTVAVRAAEVARSLTSCTTLAVQKMEQLKALTWSFADAGVVSPPVSDTTTDLSSDPPTGGGRGLAPSPSGVLDRNTPGYVDFLDRDGRWVGTGVTPPAPAVFIRRWSVTPLPADPDDSLMLQVLVTRVVVERGLATGPGDPRLPLPGDALLATVSTRRRP